MYVHIKAQTLFGLYLPHFDQISKKNLYNHAEK